MELFSHSRRNFSDVFQRSHVQELILQPISGKRLEGMAFPLFPWLSEIAAIRFSRSANDETPANSPDFAISLAFGWSGIERSVGQ
jgi:hypothetical protein